MLENLLHSKFQGKVYAVNASRPDVLDRKAYAGIREIVEPVDLAVIATPAKTVPTLIAECINARVKCAVVISAGFKEHGAEGAALEQQVQEQLRHSSMRLVGPNCLGIMNPAIGLNATFAKDSPKAGNVAFLSQSGALLTAILDWSQREQVGFSAIVSTGSMLDIGWGDLIYYFGDDPRTKSILLYMESVGDARSFVSAAREVALSKPIIVIKAGRSPPGRARLALIPERLRATMKCSMRPSAAREFYGFIMSPTSSIWRKCWANSRARKDRGSRS